MKREILTPIPLKELEEILLRSGSGIELRFAGKIERNGIPLNRVLIEGKAEETRKFLKFLMRARAGG
ncbi:TIGR04140 family protein [Thermococcus profundus]|uniref:TIGR04140 family protein n=1 Tax=Thermococcus profundus TaxID=49899 RepID=A0A2Z2MI24_THEPR|nr:TIGR04140 family protein [Thermococcus profundus]ASJ02081.1 TIGR04140 family protein [Thermococcus profundus]